MTATLDVWVAKAGDACVVDEAHWIVRISTHDGKVFAWGDMKGAALDAPHAHWSGTIPPGTYIVQASRKEPHRYVARATDRAIVTIGCEGTACVRLFVDKIDGETPAGDAPDKAGRRPEEAPPKQGGGVRPPATLRETPTE